MSSAADRGWGPGYPSPLPPAQRVQVDITGTKYPGGVRREIADLVSMLTAECKRRGYRFGIASDPAYGCWGYANRPIGGTQVPSNHSWGLAVDINAPSNPQKSPMTTNIPSWMASLWKSYRFQWGGDYTRATPDPMHFEYMGTPAQAVTDTARARVELGSTQPPTQPPGGDMPLNAADIQLIHETVVNILRAPEFELSADSVAAHVWLQDLGPRGGVGPADAQDWLMDTRIAVAQAPPAGGVVTAADIARIAAAVNDDAAARMKT